MKVQKITLLLGFLFPVILCAQQDEIMLKPRTVYPGHVIENNGDTVQGYVFFTTLIGNQTHIRFYSDPAGRELIAKYDPGDIRGYNVEGMHYASVPFSGKGYSKKKSFMICLAEGPVSLYKWYYDESAMMGGDDLNEAMGKEKVLDVDLEEGLEVQMFGVKGTQDPEDFWALGFLMKFRKKMSDYLADYPELAAKIANKEPGYTADDLVRIIEEYNGHQMSSEGGKE